MDKTYDPHAIEHRWYDHWEKHGHFAPSGEGAPYAISLPPPNVTGSLHMGHAFQDTIMDALIRYHRMQGKQTLWQGGTDHAGIATQMVVERQLNAEGKTRHDLGRDAFVERVWQWKAESGGIIQNQLRRLGASIDWDRERFTMDDGLSAAVREVFVKLHDDGLIYRGKRLVNWDPVLLTAISDLEVVSEEENGHLWSFKYPLADGSGDVIVATTRPETMLGDTAVAVHPDDERYRHLIGQQIKLPLTGRLIPIVADDYVDPEFGSGCVKITPAHDFNDYEIGLRHGLELINLFTPDARLNENAPEKYRGMTREQARDAVLADLCDAGALIETKDHKLQVPRGDRSGVIIEPYLTDQWYVAVEALAKPAIKAVEDGTVRFVPDNWKNTYFEWMRNLQDWCISRQLWWGHRIPAWYDEDGKVYVARSEDEARHKHNLGKDTKLTQDDDVLDTWFSSALWPFSTLGWPDKTNELATFYPNSVLVTGFDIIFFWVARMMMFGYQFMGEAPFKEIYIHGLIRDAEGQKMSKSKGNVLDPLDLISGITLDALVEKRTTGLMQPQMARKIEKATKKQFPDGIPAYGTDALRFTFASLATTGRDIRFDLGRIEGYRNFCNKLWNAARFVMMNTEGHEMDGDKQYSAADRWIQTKLQHTIRDYRKAMDGYRLDLAAQAIYDFTWNEYCDWYLELTKPTLQDTVGAAPLRRDDSGTASDTRGGSGAPRRDLAAQQRGTRSTLLEVLDAILRLLHPIMPFITEEIWQRTVKSGDTLMLARFPEADDAREDQDAVKAIDWIKGFILGLRRIRGEMDLSPSKPLPVLLQDASDQDTKYLAEFESWLTFLARLESVTVTTDAPESATALLGQMKILVPMAGLIDKQAELDRLDKQIQKIRKDLDKSTAKLANEQFVQNAPAAVVEQERGRIAEWETAIGELTTQREKIAAL
ncbi:MAG: valine--tRNA ligase [Gammaproteobacteria bacterium]